MKKADDHGKHKYGMVIDLDKCTGCGTCMVACAAENNISVRPDESDKERSIAWMQLFKAENGKEFPDADVVFFPRPCMHCEEDGHGHHAPSCVTVCVATATTIDHNNGIVSQIPTRCIGCRYCQAACPYKARYFNWYDAYFPKNKGLERYLSPEVSPRMRGVVEKCTFCHHRLMRAKNQAYAEGRREIEEHEYITACSEACPVQAITFGDLNNPDHKVAKLSKSKHAFRILERLNTKPKVYYLSSREWVRKIADNPIDEFTPVSHGKFLGGS